ncbi:MAG: inositol monophosphatase family protein [Pseudomonadota bacterium]|nr:inositol monophosphatase family protein [Pseudomonadota bacterium]MEC7960847.1 inositol monophosphatase family protein [Pseudomonadota bacterium]MEC8019430.1 inositol monophosphatase family protein [Pseudomonadota bacterium]MEC8797175.1 inositol monophosphatase family protein [Pseudomonadota bacterium]
MDSPLLNIMQKAAKKASRGLRRDFNELENLQVKTKGPANFVTASDIRTQKIIYEELSYAKPDWSFIMEESKPIENQNTKARFIIDPIDGTTNFMHGNPNFAISIAAEIDNRLEAAIIYSPITDEMFTAERGKGSFLNDKRIRVAARKKLSESILITGIPHLGRGNKELFIKEMDKIIPEVAGIRRSGSAALDLAWIAAGRYDIFWERDLSVWDIAAGILLVREAGGFAKGIDGSDQDLWNGNIISGNDDIILALSEKLGF